MSKSKGNGVSPDQMSDKYGVDTLRLALMFGAPPESDFNFEESFLVSMKSYLDKIVRLGDSLLLKSKSLEILNKKEIQ